MADTRLVKVLGRTTLLLFSAMLLATQALHAMKLKNQNLAEIITLSEHIIMGTVVKVTDGFQNTTPYTEVTILVGSDAKGKISEGTEYVFRQFGLTEPRATGDGRIYLGVSPEGFARWSEGEQVIAFMYKKAALTGFQTTAGMAQGKFNLVNGRVTNAFNNFGLFERLEINNPTVEEQNMLTTPGAVDVSAFMGVVSKLMGAAS